MPNRAQVIKKYSRTDAVKQEVKKKQGTKKIDLINLRGWKLGEMVRKTAAGKINGRKAFNFNWTSRVSQL